MHKACRNGPLLLPFLHNTQISPKFSASPCHTFGLHYWVISTSLGYFSPGIVAMTVLVAASMAESVLP